MTDRSELYPWIGQPVMRRPARPVVKSGRPANIVWRTGDRVLVVPLGQYGVVQGRKDGRVLVHFGTVDKREVWAWHDSGDLDMAVPEEEVVLP